VWFTKSLFAIYLSWFSSLAISACPELIEAEVLALVEQSYQNNLLHCSAAWEFFVQGQIAHQKVIKLDIKEMYSMYKFDYIAKHFGEELANLLLT
jgi:hypothetical protein